MSSTMNGKVFWMQVGQLPRQVGSAPKFIEQRVYLPMDVSSDRALLEWIAVSWKDMVEFDKVAAYRDRYEAICSGVVCSPFYVVEVPFQEQQGPGREASVNAGISRNIVSWEKVRKRKKEGRHV